MNERIKPRALKKGDRVAVVSPSTAVRREDAELAKQAVEALQLEPVMYPTCFAQHRHLSGTDEERARDVMNAFANDSVHAVFSLGGGYGASRILPLLDFDVIRRNPKIFTGYSDITALHTAIGVKSGLVTYHAPMPTDNNGFYKKVYDQIVFEPYTLAAFTRALFSNEPIGAVVPPEGQTYGALSQGVAEGELTGGNLDLVTHLLGTPWEIDTKGKILFLEEVHEYSYKVDKYLTALRLSGKLQQCAGIVLGSWTDCGEPRNTMIDVPLEAVLEDAFASLGIPVLTNCPVGHTWPQATLSLGARVRVDCNRRTLEYLESGNC